MSLADKIHIARRFQRSIRIDTDLTDLTALEGFICPQSCADILQTMARHITETGQGAFTWTGPYGSGKSSLAVALSALLNGKTELQKQAAAIFGRNLTKKIWTALPPKRKGWRIVPIVGRRDDPVSVIGEALQSAGLAQRRPRGGWTEKSLLAKLDALTAESPQTHGGLILFVDEMGKFLEGAAKTKVDIYIFQQLAEAAFRSKGRLLIIGILHQAFEEYGHRLSREMRDEWLKIQGRFVDLPINLAGEEQIDLISKAIVCRHKPKTSGPLARKISRLIYQGQPKSAEKLGLLLADCWPLHPVVACLLGPISRRRFGQNQRSIFGFLNSSEPHGFQDFLKHASKNDLYGPDRLWDYLRANLEPSILATPDGHRWALAAEGLERCEAIGGDSLHLKLLKIIAVIDLFKERSGLLANYPLLKTCFQNVSDTVLKKGLEQLKGWSFITYKKYLDAYAVFEGSDFDIDEAVKEALDSINEIDFETLRNLAGLQPILAKRHFHETGTLRWFDVALVPVCDLTESSLQHEPAGGIVGRFLLAILTKGERESATKKACQKAARNSSQCDIITGFSKFSWSISPLARELIALENIKHDHPDIIGDRVARREVDARLASLQAVLEMELRRAFDQASWFVKWQRGPKAYNYKALNSLASDLAGRRFSKSPRIHNELLNRQKPSASAVAAQNELLKRMVLDEGEKRLGIQGFPAEAGLFVSLLESTGLYAKGRNGWKFVEPGKVMEDRFLLAPIWEAAKSKLKQNSNRTVLASEIFECWRQQPYGVKEGLMPVLLIAFIQSMREKIAFYRESLFRVRFDDLDAQYLAKDPAAIQLRWLEISDSARWLLLSMAEIVRELDQENSLENLEPIDVARGLVGIYEKLPSWTKRTMRLSKNAIRIRDIFKQARDPNQLLFNDIPKALGKPGKSSNGGDQPSIAEKVKEGLDELTKAYPLMLDRLRDLMLSELQVHNASSQSLAELQARAENIKQLAGDFRLDAFISRLCEFDGTGAAMESIASLAVNKPPREWVDVDLDRAAIEIADMSQRFLRAEMFARVKGRPEKRQAMAIVVGGAGHATPVLEEFDVGEDDRELIEDLVAQLEEALEKIKPEQRRVILAALAELSMRLIGKPKEERARKRKRRLS